MDICVNQNSNKLTAIIILTLITLAGCGGSGGGSTTPTDTTTYYQDADDDGYGNLTVTQEAITQPAGYVINSTDCDDASILTHPAATENPNDGIDNNCNGLTDEVLTTYHRDLDGDTYGDLYNSLDAVTKPAGYITDNTDCDDDNAAINPSALEVTDDGVDNNCDGQQSITYYQDTDDDSYGNQAVLQIAMSQPTGYVTNFSDCDDTNPSINPGATEVTDDSIDNNCNGHIDELVAYTPLNDTGLTWGGSYPSGNNATCIGETISQQDCSHGRDATNNDDSDGHAGFSYIKLDANGNNLPALATSWSCVKDNVTGLIWEVKQHRNHVSGDGLHDADDYFNWYNSNSSTNYGVVGYSTESNEDCYGYNSSDPATYCNTQAYVERVNTAGLCGASDWRLPAVNELVGLLNFDQAYQPTIDLTYFPGTAEMTYWTSVPFIGQNYGSVVGIREVHFGSGSIDYTTDYTFDGSIIRLVRDRDE